jgi:DNA-binding SARP family transcriptional activator
VEYRVLGKLEVLRDGHPVDLGAFRQRPLALLLTAPNSVFSSDQILDELWGDAGGVDKQNALWVYVSGLRKALDPDREKRTDGSILLTRAPGYLIEAEPEQIDSLRFERMVTEGRASPTSTLRQRRSCSVSRWLSGGAGPSRSSHTSPSPRQRSPV